MDEKKLAHQAEKLKQFKTNTSLKMRDDNIKFKTI